MKLIHSNKKEQIDTPTHSGQKGSKFLLWGVSISLLLLLVVTIVIIVCEIIFANHALRIVSDELSNSSPNAVVWLIINLRSVTGATHQFETRTKYRINKYQGEFQDISGPYQFQAESD